MKLDVQVVRLVIICCREFMSCVRVFMIGSRVVGCDGGCGMKWCLGVWS